MTESIKKARPLIALDALLVNRKPTGVGRSILDLMQALCQKDRGLDFLVLATEPEMFAFLGDVPGWTVLDCPGARGGTLRKALFTQFQVPRICSRNQVDLLHSLQFIAPRFLPCPNVVTIYDLAWLRFPTTIEQPRLNYYRLLVPTTLNRCAAIVTCSQATADDTEHFFPGTAGKITPTLFGTPSWVWQQDTETPISPKGRPFFLFVGTLEPRKNLEKILEAFDLFLQGDEAQKHPVDKIPRLIFVGGKGWKDSLLQQKMTDFTAQGHLEVIDFCSNEKLWQLYRTAHALLFPSLHEGFGFPILEAMAAGLPVLTSDRGAMAEVGGNKALLVDPDNAGDIAQKMANIAWNDSLRRDLIESGFPHAKKWSWERTADLTTSVYEGLVGF